MAYVSFLKEIGIMGKRIYALKPEEWLKDYLINLHKFIKQYAKENL
jgi:hypothetical protein